MAANKAEIDTSAPFRSVKEAVTLFGERLLATELYAAATNNLQQDGEKRFGEGTMASELEETKQSLQKAREETDHMARYLSSLQQELEQTKKELHRFKLSNLGLKNDDDIDVHKNKCVTFANPPLVAQVAAPQAAAVLQRHPSLKKKKKKPLIPFNIGGIFAKKKGNSEVAYA